MRALRNIYYVHDDGTAELHCGNNRILLDVSDVENISEYQWSVGTHGYATTGCGKNQVLMHRMILHASEEELVDHINRNKLDNRRANLRICNVRQNSMNRAKLQSGNNPYKGVYLLNDGLWQAQINHKGHAIYLGRFMDASDAAKAYDTAAKQLFGEFAFLNFPECKERRQVKVRHHRKLSIDEVQSVRRLYESGFKISDIAEIYNHSYSAIDRIVCHRTFKGV